MWRNQLTVYLRCSSLTLGQDTIKGKIQNSQGTNEKLKSGWEMSRILLQDEQDRSPELSLRISREKWSLQMSSQVQLLFSIRKTPCLFPFRKFQVYYIFLCYFSQLKPLPAAQRFTSPSAQGYIRTLGINSVYLQLWHFRSQLMCQCTRDTVNLITCVSSKPFSWAGLPEPQLCFHLPYNLW